MNTPSVWQKVADHFRAFVWAGRPVVIRYVDRNYYFRDPTEFGGGEGMVTDGTCRVRRGVSTIRILLPLLADRSETLRHECGHIRFRFVERLQDGAAAEARALFWEIEPEEAALYDAHPDGKDTAEEAVVRLADRIRAGLVVPAMSPELALVVRRVVAPAPASAMAFVFVAAVALAALVL